MRQTGIIAFCHIEKAAGSTLRQQLRSSFCLRHCDVKPLWRDSGRVFRASDLRTILRINPFTCSIAGHAVVPWSDLEASGEDIRYITLLRDPMKRMISHYVYWVEAMGYSGTLDAFLRNPRVRNFQTRKIAGTEDLQRAKETIREKFLLAGVVEEYDAFVLHLKRKLWACGLCFSTDYRPENVASQRSRPQMGRRYRKINTRGLAARDPDWKKRFFGDLDTYVPRIEEANEMDNVLYRFATDLLAQQSRDAGPDFEADLARIQKAKNRGVRVPA